MLDCDQINRKKAKKEKQRRWENTDDEAKTCKIKQMITVFTEIQLRVVNNS